MTEKQRTNSEVRKRGGVNISNTTTNTNDENDKSERHDHEFVFSKHDSGSAFNFTPESLSELHDKKTIEALDDAGGMGNVLHCSCCSDFAHNASKPNEEGLGQGLETDLKKGLTESEVEKHRKA